MNQSKNFVLIVLSIGLFYTFSSAEYQKVKALQVSANEYQNVIENVSKIAQARDALLVNYEAIPEAERDKLQKALPDRIDSVRLALDLDTIASRYSISLTGVKVDLLADPNSTLAIFPQDLALYERASVNINFNSDYENMVRFLADIEKSLRIMDIKSLAFQAAEDGTYNHELKFETYWLK